MKMMEKITKGRKLDRIFREEKIVLAYLFGSQAEGKTGPLSDIDVAVLFDREVPSSEYFDRKLKVMGKLSDLWKTDNLDLVVLNQSPPLITHRILKEGRVLFSQDKKKRLEFELRAVMRYLDWKPYLQKQVKQVFG